MWRGEASVAWSGSQPSSGKAWSGAPPEDADYSRCQVGVISREGVMNRLAWTWAAGVAIPMAIMGCGSGPSTTGKIGAGGTLGSGGTSGTGAAVTVPDASSSSRPCSDLFDQTKLQTYSFEIAPTTGRSWTPTFTTSRTCSPVRRRRRTTRSHSTSGRRRSSNGGRSRCEGSRPGSTPSCSTRTPRCSSRSRSIQIRLQAEIPRRVGPAPRDAPRRLDVPERADRQQLVARRSASRRPAPTARSSRSTALLRPLHRGRSVNGALLKQFFPGNSGGDLFKGGTEAETNSATPNWPRAAAAAAAPPTSASLQPLVDLPNTVLEWAAEAVVNDADGYYGGAHNYYIYDEGAAGYVWLPDHTDSALEWLELFTLAVVQAAPDLLVGGRPLAEPPPARLPHRPQRSDLARALHRRDRDPGRQNGTSRRSSAGSTPGRRRSPTRWPPTRTSGRRPISSPRRSPRLRDVVRQPPAVPAELRRLRARRRRRQHRPGRRRRALVQRLQRREPGRASGRAGDLRQRDRRQLRRRGRRRVRVATRRRHRPVTASARRNASLVPSAA